MANEVPEYKRETEIKPSSSLPGVGREISSMQPFNNIMGTIGARVAQSASQALAEKLGTESGKNPHGELFPSINDFDKHFEQSYKAQAQSTLSIQADKLISDSQVQLANASRLTPQLIDSTNAQVASGLAKISSMAPDGVRENLQANFAKQMIHNNQHYQIHMISQQREDQRNNIVAGLELNNKNAMNFAANGDFKGAEDLLEQSKNMASGGLGSRLIDKVEAQKYVQNIEQSVINGKTINQAMQAHSEGKYAEWAKNFAKNPDKLPLDKFYNAGNAAQSQINFINSLNNQDEQLRAARMLNSIATDPTQISEGMWNDFQSNVSPLMAEKVKHSYIQAIKKNQKDVGNKQNVIAGFSDPNVIARSSPKDVNAAFDTLVNGAMQTAQKKGIPLTREQAEVQVANSAGGAVPAFQNSLRNKLSSANPQQIESAAQQIHELEQIEGGHALNGIGDIYKAAAAKYEALRSELKDPTEAAREMTTAVFNQDPLVANTVKEKWSNLLSLHTQSGTTKQDYAFSIVGTNKDKFINAGAASAAASTILETYNTYFTLTGGDQKTAQKLTKQFYKDNFGETYINGRNPIETLHPIEKSLGYSTEDVVPYIHEDLRNQLNERFAPLKQAYAEGKSYEYWEVMQPESPSFKFDPIKGRKLNLDPVKVKRYVKSGNKVSTNEFSLVLQGNAFDSWDVAVNSDSGLRNIFQIAPYLGITTYQPNKKSIDENYAKDHH